LRKVHRLAVVVVCTNAKRRGRELILCAWSNPDAKRNLLATNPTKARPAWP